MSAEDLETLEYLFEKAKRMHLSRFKFNGDFINMDIAKRLMSKYKDIKWEII